MTRFRLTRPAGTSHMDRVKGFRSREIGRWAAKHLAGDAHVRSDGLACFAAVRHGGCTHETLVTSGAKGWQRRKALVWVDTMLGTVKLTFDATLVPRSVDCRIPAARSTPVV